MNPALLNAEQVKIICSSSYDGFFSVSFSACVLRFYGVYVSYHTAYKKFFLVKK
jgi:hypothetical protein